MYIKFYIPLLFTAFAIASCTSENQDVKTTEEKIDIVKTDGDFSVSDIIRSPITGEGEMDTTKVARIEFEESAHDFGEIKEGKSVNHRFNFKNTGKVPLIISHVSSTCGCTIPKWPKDPIEAGASGSIDVKFNSEGKIGPQKKPITIIANTYPNKTKLHISLIVNK